MKKNMHKVCLFNEPWAVFERAADECRQALIRATRKLAYEVLVSTQDELLREIDAHLWSESADHYVLEGLAHIQAALSERDSRRGLSFLERQVRGDFYRRFDDVRCWQDVVRLAMNNATSGCFCGPCVFSSVSRRLRMFACENGLVVVPVSDKMAHVVNQELHSLGSYRMLFADGKCYGRDGHGLSSSDLLWSNDGGTVIWSVFGDVFTMFEQEGSCIRVTCWCGTAPTIKTTTIR